MYTPSLCYENVSIVVLANYVWLLKLRGYSSDAGKIFCGRLSAVFILCKLASSNQILLSCAELELSKEV